MQHVRECPDFAESGACKTKGCRLPHVIRANRNRPQPTLKPASEQDAPATAVATTDYADDQPQKFAEDAQLGDEFISLTFHESDSSSEEEDDSEAEDEEQEEDNTEDRQGDDE